MMLSYIIWSMYFIGDILSRVGRTWRDYWNKFLGNILSYIVTANDPPDPMRSSTEKAQERNIILLPGLMDASSKYMSVPNIDLSR